MEQCQDVIVAVTGFTRVFPEAPLVRTHLLVIGQSFCVAIQCCNWSWEDEDSSDCLRPGMIDHLEMDSLEFG